MISNIDMLNEIMIFHEINICFEIYVETNAHNKLLKYQRTIITELNMNLYKICNKKTELIQLKINQIKSMKLSS